LADATGVDTEPALIDPALKVDSGHPDIAGSFMSYWPRYAEITAAARAAYLRWLAGGRKELGKYSVSPSLRARSTGHKRKNNV
jgi:hypothetical protein